MPVALVTGASQGLGRALARNLVSTGWTVVVDARDGRLLGDAFAGLDPTRVVAVPGDVTDPEHRQELRREVERLGGLDLLVNNASHLGPSPQPPLADYPLADLQRVLDVDLLAPLAVVQAVLPHLRSRGGVIVNVSSDAAIEPYAGWGGYGSAKAALDQLSAVLGVEHPDLRVYALDPGDMRTAMHQQAFPGEDITDRPEPETVVPAFRWLLQEQPPSGRYRAADLRPAAGDLTADPPTDLTTAGATR